MRTDRRRLLACVAALAVSTAGCASEDGSPRSASDDGTGSPETTERSLNEKLGHRLVLVPVEADSVDVRVRIVDQSTESVVVNRNVTLESSRDFTSRMVSGVDYRVRVTAGDEERTYLVSEYAGYTLYLTPDGVKRVEKVVL
ncbi:hypothetical protein BRD10_00430 [Halobacteriales archaeon SW_12_71_31]|nr:MAG: hypothetical protein BRD10_00430 [Halobacteriales archaeon SW_12_71_31]